MPAAYSRLSRGAVGFIPIPLFATGALTALVFFFLLRVLDEHKDAETDRRYRPELPVPRGAVRLAELRAAGGVALGIVLALNAAMAPPLLWACLLVAAWAALMTKEFFAGSWLREHPTAYLLSHMLIMPMIDAYTTGLDWLVQGEHPGAGIWLFLIVTFLNGTLLEISRKIRSPEDEREGVDTYTRVWGTRAAPAVWLGVLAAATAFIWLAARLTGAGPLTAVALLALAAMATVPAARFFRRPSRRGAKLLDTAAGLWVLATYLLLGAGPYLARG